ncbi:MAG: UPF0175 family protein [Calothrix sp. FI2-JRJ7]|nr:UPF0175 family protein [Calothrix sp. FI2-JRJ7]
MPIFIRFINRRLLGNSKSPFPNKYAAEFCFPPRIIIESASLAVFKATLPENLNGYPDDIVYQLADNPEQLSRRALESLVVDAYRSRQLSTAEVQRILNLPGRLATDAFLKAHEAYLPYTETDLVQYLQSINQALFKVC